MFTGLIEAVCEVRSVRAQGASGTGALVVDLGLLAEGCAPGDSVAVSGACLTVTSLDSSTVTFGLSAETLEKTTLATLKPRSRVNIERAMPAGGRFGGHIVQGHVDGTGTIRAVKQQGDFADIEVGAPAELLGQMVSKGSVAVDGVSLTIAALGRESLRVAAIPETLQRTTLGAARIGQQVNIEIDLIVKAVRRQLEQMLGDPSILTVERLREMGF